MGTVFRITPAGVVTKLVDFDRTNGGFPGREIALAANGALYGTTQQGGTEDRGVVYKVTTSGTFSVVGSLSDAVGSTCQGGLVAGPDGGLYGLGGSGGANGAGTVFKVTTAGAGSVSKIADLASSTTGGYPNGTLTVGPDGALYGGIRSGGATGNGTAIRVTTSGAITKLADFSENVSGADPYGQMVLAGDGSFYGVTSRGPNQAGGVVYRLTPAGALSVVAYAQQQYGSPTGAFGEISGTEFKGLALTDDGALLGVAGRGGPSGKGTIFRLSTFIAPTTGFFVTGAGGYIPAAFTGAYATNGTLIKTESSVAATRTYTITNLTASPVTVNNVTKTGSSNIALNVSGLPVTLAPNGTHSFTMTYLSPLPDGDVTVTVASNEVTTPSYQFQVHGRVSRLVKVADFPDPAATGFYPRSDLLPDAAGNFYAMTTYGAQGGGGAAIKVTPTGTITPLAALSTIEGSDLYGEFVNGPGGLLYGFTAGSGGGRFFSMTPAGVLTLLASASTVGSSSIYGSPVLADDGNFYGLTRFGGIDNNGTIFRVTPAGIITRVFTFNATTGTHPNGSLIKGIDGALYGMTSESGANYAGTVFKFTTAGVFTKLVDFNFNTTGAYPQEDLIEGSDGNFYGLATTGGTNGVGTVFKMTPAGVLTKLADFESVSTGKYPDGSLVEASDGNFYGLTSEGGAGGAGTVFRMTPAGVLTKLADFDSATSGKKPLGSLVEGSPGTLYGTASGGGVGDNGTIFKVLIGVPPPSNTAPTAIALSPSHISENNAANATVGTLTATDSNLADTHTFTFAGGADDAAFTITGATLSINDSADFETKSSYAIRIRATDSGAGNLFFEEDLSVSITAVTIPQSITFGPLDGKTFGDAPFAVSATGGASGQSVTFSIFSGPATIAGDTVTITGAGSVTVRASQAGAGDYSAAADVDQTFAVAQAGQTISFAPLGGKTFGDAPFAVSATGGASGQSVTFSIFSGPATIAGNTVTITGVGDVTVRASQAGAGNYAAATPVDQTFTVAKAAQSIAFTAPAIAATTESLTLSATGGASGNAVTFSVFSGPGSLAGNVLTFSGAGTVVVRASQAGNANYFAAADVDASINVVVNNPPIAVDDAVRITAGVATVYPLANDSDADGDELTITAVSEGSVTIAGRTLIVPAGYTGTFNYTVSDGISTDTADVVVTAQAPQTARNRWSGLLTDSTGAIVGRMSATRTTKGSFTGSVRVGATTIVSAFSLRPEPNGNTTVPTMLGNLTVTENDATGRLNVSLTHSGGPFTGSLRRSALTGTVQTHNVALASIDAAYPGGGIARVSVRSTGFVVLTVTMPDGKTLSANLDLADNGTFSIYSPVGLTSPTAYVAGEFNFANLAATDLTGELAWIKPAQTAAGLHQSGVSTTLTANGCVFAPGVSALPAGAGTLTISGGNLASSNTTARTITAGKPTVNALVPAWTAFPLKGTFTAKIKTPANPRTVTGSGIYLPKSNSAWGFFPGTTLGGRIELK